MSTQTQKTPKYRSQVARIMWEGAWKRLDAAVRAYYATLPRNWSKAQRAKATVNQVLCGEFLGNMPAGTLDGFSPIRVE